MPRRKSSVIDWRRWLIPAPVALAALAAAWGAVQWGGANLVFAAEFQQYQVGVERRILTTQQRQLESEVLRLEIKREAYPRKFDAVDKAVLKKQAEQLNEIRQEIRKLDDRSKTK
jgi:hypothetical protein